MTCCSTRRRRAKGFSSNVPKFDVAAGDEVQSCYFFAVPGPAGQDVWVNHFKLAANAGTHHMNIFRVKTVVGLGGQPGDVVVSKNGIGPCFVSSNWADWPLVANTQHGGTTVDWTLPDGVGQKFSGGELLMVQIHFVNATTQTDADGRTRRRELLHDAERAADGDGHHLRDQSEHPRLPGRHRQIVRDALQDAAVGRDDHRGQRTLPLARRRVHDERHRLRSATTCCRSRSTPRRVERAADDDAASTCRFPTAAA